MVKEKREKNILWLSFFAGLAFAVVELVYAIVSHSQSVLMDAVYDAVELIFIGLILFLTPLFYQPVSEKHPYGYFQIETIFLIIKSVMMFSVTLGVSTQVVQSALEGGNPVDSMAISIFQLILGMISVVIYGIMKQMGRKVTSPTVDAELLGWKIDIAYSMGMSAAFFGSRFLQYTPLRFLAPYFDQIIAVTVMLLTLPEMARLLWGAIQSIFMFSPEGETVDAIKTIANRVLEPSSFTPVFFDVTRTGRHLWVEIYFKVPGESVQVSEVRRVTETLNQEVGRVFQDCTCELTLDPYPEKCAETKEGEVPHLMEVCKKKPNKTAHPC